MKKILTECDGGSIRDLVSWNEFKFFRRKCAVKKQMLIDFLRNRFDKGKEEDEDDVY